MEFLRTSGVVYNALMTKRYKSDSSLDVSTFDIESWIRRDSHFLPTWGNLLMILRNMDFKREATRIERYLKEIPRKQGSEVELGMSLHNVDRYSHVHYRPWIPCLEVTCMRLKLVKVYSLCIVSIIL